MIMTLFLVVFTAHVLILVFNAEHSASLDGYGSYNGAMTFWFTLVSLITFIFFASKSINLFLVGA